MRINHRSTASRARAPAIRPGRAAGRDCARLLGPVEAVEEDVVRRAAGRNVGASREHDRVAWLRETRRRARLEEPASPHASDAALLEEDRHDGPLERELLEDTRVHAAAATIGRCGRKRETSRAVAPVFGRDGDDRRADIVGEVAGSRASGSRRRRAVLRTGARSRATAPPSARSRPSARPPAAGMRPAAVSAESMTADGAVEDGVRDVGRPRPASAPARGSSTRASASP